jgi:hypothetical protein
MSQQFVMRKGMTVMAAKKASGSANVRHYTHVGKYKPITPVAIAAIIKWLNLPEEMRAANHKLLTVGLPSGSISGDIRYRANPDRMEVMTKYVTQSTPRVFDLATFAMMRLLTAYAGKWRMNNNISKKTKATKKELHYVDVTFVRQIPPLENLSIGILIWGSQTNSHVMQVSPSKPKSNGELLATFYDWTIANLKSKDEGKLRHNRNRADALSAALIQRTAHELSGPSDKPPSETEYSDAIKKCFTLLDGLRDAVLKQRAANA